MIFHFTPRAQSARGAKNDSYQYPFAPGGVAARPIPRRRVAPPVLNMGASSAGPHIRARARSAPTRKAKPRAAAGRPWQGALRAPSLLGYWGLEAKSFPRG